MNYKIQELVGSIIVIILTWMHYVRQSESGKIRNKQHKLDLIFCVVLGYIFNGVFGDILINYFKIAASEEIFDYKLIGVAWIASIIAIEVYYKILVLVPKTVELFLGMIIASFQAALKKALGDKNERNPEENTD